MTEIPNGCPGSPQSLFASAGRIRIPQLALGQPTEPEATPYVEAVVSLVWPYSSKEGLLSLLLAEPDVRLRSAKGQLKVTFHGAGARQVAKSQLGIGDIVLLRIDHAEWKDTGDAVLTPGKKVQWDLHFKNRVVLEGRRNGDLLTTIDYEGSETTPPALEAASQDARLQQADGFHANSSVVFTTLAAGRSQRISSGSFIDASLDPFADDDGFILGKGRKKTKFGRTSGSWRLVDEGETGEHEDDSRAPSEESVAPIVTQTVLSPPPSTFVPSEVIILDGNSSQEASPSEVAMPPPLTPFQQRLPTASEADPETDCLTTPRLHALASPSLPMVSPLVKVAGPSTGYFDLDPPASSELDATSVSSASPQARSVASAGENSLFDDSPKDFEEPAEDAERVPSNPLLNSTFEEAVPPARTPSLSPVKPQSAAFSNPSTTSPLGFLSGGLPDFELQSTSAATSTALGNSTVQATHEAPATLFGNQVNTSSSTEWSGFRLSREDETGVGFSFATPAVDASAEALAGSQHKTGSQIPAATEPHRETHQERESTAEQQPDNDVSTHIDLSISHRERKLSEDDDDMYGSARPLRSSLSIESVTSGRSGSREKNGEGSMDVTISDRDSGKLRPVASPSPQDVNNEMQTKSRFPRQSPFLDGASDEMSEYESSENDSDAEVQPGPISSVVRSESLELVESVEAAADLEFIDRFPPETTGDDGQFESLTRAQIAVGPILDLQGRPTLQVQAVEPISMHVFDYEDDVEGEDEVEDLTMAQPEFEQQRVMQNTEDKITDHERTEEELLEVDATDPKAIQEQLLTPANTQQDFQVGHSFPSIEQVPSIQMPPTPDNTQEAAYADILRLDGTDEPRPIHQEVVIIQASTPSSAPNGKGTSHLTRKALNVPAVSSPYFTPRRSSRLSPERQTQHIERKEPEAVVNQEMEVEQRLQDLPASEPVQPITPSPRHEKRLYNMLGVATPLSYYTPLSNLDEHYDQQVDILAVCTADSGAPLRSKSGPRDYSVTLHLADSFLNGAATVTAQLFRPYKSALPLLLRGDVILLRAFRVQSQKRKMMLLSTDSSAWAVFSSSDSSVKNAEHQGLRIDVAGPPIEHGPEEYAFAQRLMEWWQMDGSLVHKVMTPKTIDSVTRPRTRDGPDWADATDNRSEQVTNGTTNGLGNAYKAQGIDSPRPPKSSRRTNNLTDNMENHNRTRGDSAPLSPTLEPTSPIQARATRASRRAANRTDNTRAEADAGTAETMDQREQMVTPKPGRHTRRSTSISETPELSRSLRSQSTVHELRDGTKYVDGHVPTKKDGVHQLRDGKMYVDENVSPAGKKGGNREESLVHELRDGTNYVDRGKSPEVRRSARNKRGGSVVHELRDGATYTDG
jgi:hypothetical protein